MLNDITQLKYVVGISSTGSFVILYHNFEKNANFIAKIDIENATKDGLFIYGYVVNIPCDKIEKLNGKIVNISGKVTLTKLSNLNKVGQLEQGKNSKTMHILIPKIKIVE